MQDHVQIPIIPIVPAMHIYTVRTAYYHLRCILCCATLRQYFRLVALSRSISPACSCTHSQSLACCQSLLSKRLWALGYKPCLLLVQIFFIRSSPTTPTFYS